MGASEFFNVAEGKTADAAFKKLVDWARWEYGHGGYTGTIAEKQSFVEFARPKGMRRDKVIEAVRALGGYALPDALRPSVNFGRSGDYQQPKQRSTTGRVGIPSYPSNRCLRYTTTNGGQRWRSNYGRASTYSLVSPHHNRKLTTLQPPFIMCIATPNNKQGAT